MEHSRRESDMTDGHTLNNGRLTTLEKRQNHMDEQLGVLSQDMASVKASIPGIVDTLSKISDKVNAPPVSTNWFGLVGAFVSVVLIMGGGVNLVIAPILKNLDRQNNFLTNLNEKHYVMAQDISEQGVRIEWLRSDTDHKDEQYYQWQERVDVLESKAAAAEISRRAIGNYAKNLEARLNYERNKP